MLVRVSPSLWLLIDSHSRRSREEEAQLGGGLQDRSIPVVNVRPLRSDLCSPRWCDSSSSMSSACDEDEATCRYGSSALDQQESHSSN